MARKYVLTDNGWTDLICRLRGLVGCDMSPMSTVHVKHVKTGSIRFKYHCGVDYTA